MTHMSPATHHTFEPIVGDSVSEGWVVVVLFLLIIFFSFFFFFNINSFPSALLNSVAAL